MTGYADLVAPSGHTPTHNPDPFARAVAALLEDGVPVHDASRTVNAIRNRHEDAYLDALARHGRHVHPLTAAHHAAQTRTP